MIDREGAIKLARQVIDQYVNAREPDDDTILDDRDTLAGAFLSEVEANKKLKIDLELQKQVREADLAAKDREIEGIRAEAKRLLKSAEFWGGACAKKVEILAQLRAENEKLRASLGVARDENSHMHNLLMIARMRIVNYSGWECECDEPEYRSEDLKCWQCRTRTALASIEAAEGKKGDGA